MSLFDTLPTDVIEIIYQYDGRYKKEYDLLLKELLYRTPYWRIKFLDRKTENEGRFESKRKEIKYISDYWNNTYAGYYNEPLNQNVEEEFLTDNLPNNYYVIFSDIKVLNMFNWVFNNNEVRLIRKNYVSPEQLALTKGPENQHQSNATA